MSTQDSAANPPKRTTRATARRGRGFKTTSKKNNAESLDLKVDDESLDSKIDAESFDPKKEKNEEESNSKEPGSKEGSSDDNNEEKQEKVAESGITPTNGENESSQQSANEVPELDEAPPPLIVTTPTQTAKTLKLKTSFSTEEVEEKKSADDASDNDDVLEVPIEKKEIDVVDLIKSSPKAEVLEEMTVIDEVTDDSDKNKHEDKLEPETELVSEDELPDANKEPLDTEAVSDEELPASGDLPDTEAVSEDELPPEGSEKKPKKKKTRKSTKPSSKAPVDEAKETSDDKESLKRKLDKEGYDPSSPTSETSDESPAKKSAKDNKSSGIPKPLPELEKFWKAVKEDASDFTGWTYLLQYVDQENDIEAAREAYDAFLCNYPYCYGYWRKYADYEKRKGNKDKCEEVFERGLKAIPFSVDLWIHYLNYCKATFAEDEDLLRATFEKALDKCGLEFRSDRLWEAYLKWEGDKKNVQNVTKIYDRLLVTPTQAYQTHFDGFCEHVNSHPPFKILSVDEFMTLRQEVLQVLRQSDSPSGDTVLAAPGDDTEAPPGEEPAADIAAVASSEETAKIREKIIAARKKMYTTTKEAVIARQSFEEGIKRPYFHVKPLERCQLKNWKDYLCYELEQGDAKRIIVLFERCLIACALYEDFWMRYVRYLEEKMSDNVDLIRDVYERACTIHHKKKPTIQLHWSVFEEMQGNYEKGEEILENLEKIVPNLIQVIYRRINLARRSGKHEKVSELYEHYIEKTKNKIISNNFTIKYSRFCWKILGDIDKAITVLKNALDKDKENPRLYLQLIDMAMERKPVNESEIIGAIDLYLTQDTAEIEQQVMFAQRKIEFLEDFGSSVKDVQKATDEFQKFLKILREKKKKELASLKRQQEEQIASSTAKKSKSDSKDSISSYSAPQSSNPPPSSGPYSAPNYNQSGYNQPPPQGYQGGYNQNQPPQYNQPPYGQPPPYNQGDPNYNYQNWGYGQNYSGNYNQWGGYNYY